MLTILAYIVFVPALVWNVLLWGVTINAIANDKKYHLVRFRNFSVIILSLALLLIPGVYLFGWE
jgi:hypothetical protein